MSTSSHRVFGGQKDNERAKILDKLDSGPELSESREHRPPFSTRFRLTVHRFRHVRSYGHLTGRSSSMSRTLEAHR